MSERGDETPRRGITSQDEITVSYERYMREHPELKAALDEFMYQCVTKKPEDVRSFAAEFFASYKP